jgi:hypothetical protein
MKAKSQKNSSTRRVSNNFSNNLYNNFLRLENLIVSNKFPNWTQVENTKNFQIFEEFDHTHSFIWILCYKIFFLEFEQWKQPRSFDLRNAWWTINNLHCGIDVNIKSTCCNNFTQIIEIQLVRWLLVNIIEFAFGENLFIGQSERFCDC